MVIKIRSDGHQLTIPVPLSLITNGFVNHIVAEKLSEMDPPIRADQWELLGKALKKKKKNFGSLVLVDVESKDGQKVKIIL